MPTSMSKRRLPSDWCEVSQITVQPMILILLTPWQEVEQEEEVREVEGVLYSKMMLVDQVLTHQYIVTDSRTFKHRDRVHNHHVISLRYLMFY